MTETEYRERSAGATLGGLFFGLVFLRAFGPGASLIGAVVGAAAGWWALRRR